MELVSKVVEHKHTRLDKPWRSILRFVADPELKGRTPSTASSAIFIAVAVALYVKLVAHGQSMSSPQGSNDNSSSSDVSVDVSTNETIYFYNI